MGEFLSYSIMSGLYMLAMYLAYRLFLARDNQHVFNRCILLLIYFVSFVVTPIVFSIEFGTSSPAVSMMSDDLELINISLSVQDGPFWPTILIWMFSIGMVVVFIKTIITWLRIINVIRTGQKIKQDGYTLVVTSDQRYAPFSWMRYMVISRSDYENGYSTITTHELKHVTSLHCLDLLVAQCVCIINWFNPAVWLMRDELMLVHEYQADMAVIKEGYDPQVYQLLLIKKAVGTRFPSLANSLNHSKLKKRITMMYKEKSSAGRKFKALALVPTLALAVGVASVPTVHAAVSAIRSCDVSVSKDSEKLSEDKTSVQYYKVIDIVSNGDETTVAVKGEGLGNHMHVSGGIFVANGKTYHAKALKADMTDGIASIVLTFPFKFSGDYKNTSMSITLNGKEVPFILDKFNTANPTVVAQDKTLVQYYKVTDIISNGGETTVVVKGEGLGNHMHVSGGIFVANGKSYHAKALKADMTDGIASIVLTFPFKFSGDYKNTSMSITLNGKEVPFILDKFNTADPTVVAVDD